MHFTKGKKQSLINSIIDLAHEKGIDLSENETLQKGLLKMNERELGELEELISDLVK